MAFHQQLDAVAEAAIELDGDAFDHAAGEQPEAVAGVVVGTRAMRCRVKFAERTSTALSHGHPVMLPPGMKRLAQTMSQPDFGLRDHAVEHAGIVVVVGRIHQRSRRACCGEAGHDGGMRAAAVVADELDRIGLSRRARLVSIAGRVSSSSRS